MFLEVIPSGLVINVIETFRVVPILIDMPLPSPSPEVSVMKLFAIIRGSDPEEVGLVPSEKLNTRPSFRGPRGQPGQVSCPSPILLIKPVV